MWRPRKEVYCRVCGIAELAQAYDLTRQAGFGQLYDEAGDRQKAVEYYAKFVELWRDADPELQPRVEAAQRRIDEIFAETG